VLTQTVGWHWNFLINLPIGLATLVASSRLLPDNEGLGFGEGLDVTGSVLATAGMMLGIYAIVASSEVGLTSPRVLVTGGAAVALLASFLVLQARLANPIMPLRILRARGLLSSSVVRGLTVVGLYATFFLGALNLQRVGGYDTLQTGAAFLPMTVAVLALSLGTTARLMARFGARRTALLGLLTMLAGVLVFTRIDGATGYFPGLFVGFLLVGLGGGTLFTPLLTIAIADVAAHDAGLASGIVNVSQNVSAAFAVAVLGAAAQGQSGRLLAQGYAPLSALEGGFRAGYVVAAVSVALGLVVALVALRDHQQPDAAEAVLAEEELALAA
jgi:MFS family permease